VRRSPEEFPGIYQEHSEAILRFLAVRVFDPEVAFDLLSETFAAAFVSWPRFRGETRAELEAWLYAIARAQLSHYYRKGKAEQRAVRRLGLQVPALVEEDYARIEELASMSDLRANLREALAELNDDQREALRLRVIEEKPYPEVAAELGISEQTVRARVSRGLRALAGALDGLDQARGSES
jgi:RNA polymerase sigma-70 factor (ECF subfamily)